MNWPVISMFVGIASIMVSSWSLGYSMGFRKASSMWSEPPISPIKPEHIEPTLVDFAEHKWKTHG
jgi:hypothetical protein